MHAHFISHQPGDFRFVSLFRAFFMLFFVGLGELKDRGMGLTKSSSMLASLQHKSKVNDGQPEIE